jgi:hypothetical protein
MMLRLPPTLLRVGADAAHHPLDTSGRRALTEAVYNAVSRTPTRLLEGHIVIDTTAFRKERRRCFRPSSFPGSSSESKWLQRKTPSGSSRFVHRI